MILGYYETIQARGDIASVFQIPEDQAMGGWLEDVTADYGMATGVASGAEAFEDPRDKFVMDNFTLETPGKKNNHTSDSEDFYADLFRTP